MAQLLDDERGLLASAMEGIDALVRQMQEFMDSHPGTYELDPETNNRGVAAVRLRLEEPVSLLNGRPELGWGIAADEIVGKMRAALDHAVYSLSAHDQDGGFHPDQPQAGTQFPIFANNRNYFTGQKRRKRYLEGLTEEHKKVIDGFQPFSRGTVTENDNDPLLDLHSLDNRKKHRATNVAFMLRVSGSGSFKMDAVDPPVWSGNKFQFTRVPWRFEDGAVILLVKLPPEVRKVNFQYERDDARFDAFFGVRKISVTRLREIHQYVYSIIARLEALLD
jgi:hypothetical protein